MSIENAILELASGMKELAAAVRGMLASPQMFAGFNQVNAALADCTAQPLVDRTNQSVKEVVQEITGDKFEVIEAKKPAAGATESTTAPAPAAEEAQPDAELEAAVSKVEDEAKEAAPLDYAKDVKPVLLALVKAKQKPALVDLLAKYNAKNGEQIKADDFAAIVADANALIAA